MKEMARWEDVDLTRFCLEPSFDRAIIEITNCYDGSDLATITCSGILVVKINSALTPNGSTLPVFVGELVVRSYASSEAAGKLLADSDYGFVFENGKILPRHVLEVFEIVIRGGEIEACMIAIDCQTTATPDSPPS